MTTLFENLQTRPHETETANTAITDHLMTSEEQAESELELIIFSTDTCSVCHAVKPRLLQLADKYSIPVRLVDTQSELEFASQLLVFTVPTVLLMLDGREISRESRFIDFTALERVMSAASGGI